METLAIVLMLTLIGNLLLAEPASGAGRSEIHVQNSFGPSITVNVNDRARNPEPCPAVSGSDNAGLTLRVSINGYGCPTNSMAALDSNATATLGWPLVPSISLVTTWGVIVNVHTSGRSSGGHGANSSHSANCQAIQISNSDGIVIDLLLTDSSGLPAFQGIYVNNQRGIHISNQANNVGCGMPDIKLTNVHGAVITVQGNL